MNFYTLPVLLLPVASLKPCCSLRVFPDVAPRSSAAEVSRFSVAALAESLHLHVGLLFPR